jgi:hypothetical protein
MNGLLWRTGPFYADEAEGLRMIMHSFTVSRIHVEKVGKEIFLSEEGFSKIFRGWRLYRAPAIYGGVRLKSGMRAAPEGNGEPENISRHPGPVAVGPGCRESSIRLSV